jgi:hypothetical protein
MFMMLGFVQIAGICQLRLVCLSKPPLQANLGQAVHVQRHQAQMSMHSYSVLLTGVGLRITRTDSILRRGTRQEDHSQCSCHGI